MHPTEAVYFVHITDTHIGPTPDYVPHGHPSLPCAQRVVEIINNLPIKPDFVVHTGDVVTDPEADSYLLAAETFSRLNLPIYYVNGNHDTADYIRRYLPMGPKEDLSGKPHLLSYAFEVKGYRFLILDARGPDEIEPHGLLSEEQLEIARRELQAEGPPLTVFIHFPCLPLNSIWMDAYMLVLNGDKLHRMLVEARHRLRGVFFGHVHQHMQMVRDGVMYSSAASVFSQFTAWPGDATTGLDPDHPPAYSFVHLLPQQTIVHQHVFPRPPSRKGAENE